MSEKISELENLVNLVAPFISPKYAAIAKASVIIIDKLFDVKMKKGVNVLNVLKGVFEIKDKVDFLDLSKELKQEVVNTQTSADVKVETKPESKTLINIHEYDFSKMNMKYLIKEDIIEAPEDFTISGDYTWIHVNDSHHLSHTVVGKKKATGHFPLVIDENGYVHFGGHSGNDICSSFKSEKFAKQLTGKAKYYFVIRVPFECNPKHTVYGISNVLEVK